MNLGISIATIKNPSSQQGLTFTYAFASGGITYSSAFINNTNILTPDSLTSCSLSFTPATVYTDTVATFSFTTKNALDTNGRITVNFPNTWTNAVSTAYPPLTSSTVTCTKVSGTALANSLSCDTNGQQF